jgi:hypothetical protein
MKELLVAVDTTATADEAGFMNCFHMPDILYIKRQREMKGYIRKNLTYLIGKVNITVTLP